MPSIAKGWPGATAGLRPEPLPRPRGLCWRSATLRGQRSAVPGPTRDERRVARLRRHFDDPLLVRDGRVYQLSTFAQSLVEPVREAMAAAEAAATVIRVLIRTDTRLLHHRDQRLRRAGVPAPLLARLADDAPQIRLRLVPITVDMGDALRAELGPGDLPREPAGGLDSLPRRRCSTTVRARRRPRDPVRHTSAAFTTALTLKEIRRNRYGIDDATAIRSDGRRMPPLFTCGCGNRA